MKVLVVNCGSSSLKYQLIDMTSETVMAKGICERIGIDGLLTGSSFDGEKFVVETPMPTHVEAVQAMITAICKSEHAVISDMSEIDAVGHRIVQGGNVFKESVLIDDCVVEKIDELGALAPLHNPVHVLGIKSCQTVLGKDVPQVAVFDTTFHSTMPEEAYMYALPYEYYEKHAIRRYGAHGTSHKFVSKRCAEVMGLESLEGVKMVTCHLGNGCSISAVKDGICIDTSMGLTPLEGLMMGTRCGSIDPSIIGYLAEKENLTFKEIDTIMNKKSGSLGVSGVSSDDRDLIAAGEEGNKRAVIARKMQHYQIKKLVGSYIAAMDGVDVIVFTGGLGENTIDMRENVCNGLSYLGIKIDSNKNAATRKGAEGEISTADSKVKVFVIPTNEELMIARDTKSIVEKL